MKYWQLKTNIATQYRSWYQTQVQASTGSNDDIDIEQSTPVAILDLPLPVLSKPTSKPPAAAHDHKDDLIEGAVEEHAHHKEESAAEMPKCPTWDKCNELATKYRIVAGVTWGKAEKLENVKNDWDRNNCNDCYPKPEKEKHRHTKKWVPATGFGGRSTMELVFNRQIDMSKRKDGDIWIGMLVPMTTAFGDEVRDYTELIFWEKLWPSFIQYTYRSLLDNNDPYVYTFLIGYDNGDPILDNIAEMTSIYNRMMSQLKESQIPTWKVGLMAYRLNDTQGAPSWAVSHIAQAAYDMGCEYMYQINDDTAMANEGWEAGLINELKQSKGVGVTGPVDANNKRILTQSFVHRTHVAIFDAYFSGEFKNWFSDDWLSSVYGNQLTYREHGVHVVHFIQKSRYEVDDSAKKYLSDSINAGQSKIRAYLAQHPELGVKF